MLGQAEKSIRHNIQSCDRNMKLLNNLLVVFLSQRWRPKLNVEQENHEEKVFFSSRLSLTQTLIVVEQLSSFLKTHNPDIQTSSNDKPIQLLELN